MDKMVIQGGTKLQGSVHASGSKNAALPLLISTLLAEGEHVFHNVPKLNDVVTTLDLLRLFGCESQWDGPTLRIQVGKIKTSEAPYDLVRKMRASILCLGPLVARTGKARVSLPGGCAIGTRPINLHIEALKTLNANIDIENGYVVADAPNLRGATIVFDSPTVTGTENVLMAASLADGTTTIENAAKEPHVVDMCDYMVKMGAKIKGIGTSIIEITGVEKLKPAEHKIIPDQIEAGTLLIAGAITGGEVTVTNCAPDHLEALTSKLKESGFKISTEKESITVHENRGYRGVDITTAPHPGFATDLQAQFMALMTQSEGASIITETIFENRFMHVQELVRLNADITPKTRTAVVRGKRGGLMGAPVMATDLRASACLVLAGLVAQGETTVNRIYHLDRGYEKMEAKLGKLGAKIRREK